MAVRWIDKKPGRSQKEGEEDQTTSVGSPHNLFALPWSSQPSLWPYKGLIRPYIRPYKALIRPYKALWALGMDFHRFPKGSRRFSGSSGCPLAPGSPWPSLGAPLARKQTRNCYMALYKYPGPETGQRVTKTARKGPYKALIRPL